jgi:hypothetical protein
MFRLMSSLLGVRQRPARVKAARSRTQLGVEGLEDRFLMSVSPMLSRPILSAARYATAAPAATVPNLVGVSFYLSTTSNPYAGVVTIQSETPFSDVMKITGTWDLESAGTKNNPFSGSLGYDGFGNLQIDITDGYNTLVADITKVYPDAVSQSYAYGYSYSLYGSWSTVDGGWNSGVQVTGWGQPPPPLFAL